MEIASCFRSDVEPLFQLVDQFLATPHNPSVSANIVRLNAEADLATRYTASFGRVI